MKILLLILITLSIVACNLTKQPSQKLNCSDFKIGTFRLEYDTPFYSRTEIIRKNKFQIEKNLLTGKTDTLTINWINDCTYKLNTSKEKDTSFIKNFKLSDITAEIIRITGDTIYVSATLPGVDYKPVVKMFKIR